MAQKLRLGPSSEKRKTIKAVLDTSCLVSFFIQDSHSTKAKEVLEKLVNGEINGLIPAIVIAELAGVIRRNTDELTAREVLLKMRRLIENYEIKVIPISLEDTFKSSELAIAVGLKGADATIANVAIVKKAKLMTFDEEIKKKVGERIEFL